MKMAELFPQTIQKMIVIDIAPRYYPVHHHQILSALKSINFEEFISRKQAEDVLQHSIDDIGTRQFLLKNIYWISDGYREKFQEKSLGDYFHPAQGMATSDNERFVRFWWEVNQSLLSQHTDDNLKWKNYSKGGPFNKWFGNNWTVVNWENNGYEIKNNKDELGKVRSRTQNEQYYLKEGVTYTASGSKGASFRIHIENSLFDIGGSCIFPKGEFINISYLLAFINSKLAFNILESLNPTVNTTQGDIARIPFVIPSEENEKSITAIANENIEIKKRLSSFRIIDVHFLNSPLISFKNLFLKERIKAFLDLENFELTKVLINEAILNELIFEIYELSDVDRKQVENKLGPSIGSLPINKNAKDSFLNQISNPNEILVNYLNNIPNLDISPVHQSEINENFNTLYQNNNDLEEFCIRHKVNPINVWYWFNEANVIPQARAEEITLEYVTDVIRTLLMEDEDGIIPLVGLPGEPRLLERIEQHCLNNGFTSAQFMQLDGLLGKPINDFIEHSFFRKLSDHLNLFMYMPKTPFIWHLSSGDHQGFEAYIIIYKWNADSLFKLKSYYLSKRVESLDYRLIQLQGIETAQAQTEKETIRLQLKEIEIFTAKIDELIAEGYNPKLDDGVAKNIAPLQKKGLLKAEVLKAPQLTKYLNADW